MCGRFALGVPHDQIQQMHGYNVQVGEWVAQEHFHPRYNVSPRSYAPVVRRRQAGGASSNNSGAAEELALHTMKWGLVPHWNKHEDGNLNTINARCEGLVEGGGMWASIKGKKRCAVPCQGYYEWLKKGKERLPHFTKRADGGLMLLAGLFDCVTLEGQTEPLWTFTIVTTDANKEFSWLHDRQPVILSSTEALNTWLDTSSGTWTAELTKLVRPYHDESMHLICYQVPKEVGKVGTESPTFIEPIAQRRDGIQAMFAKQAQAKSSSSSQSSPAKAAKRKRSASPEQSLGSPARKAPKGTLDVIDLCDEDEKEGERPNAEKMNTWEDDSEVEYIDKPQTTRTKAKASANSQKSPTSKNKETKNDSGNKTSGPNIMSFFSKA